MTFIDSFLNRITMYRLVLYYLLALIAIAVIESAVGLLPYSPIALLFTTILFVSASVLANAVFAWAFDATPGSDSTIITALILALIVSPVSPHNIAGIAFVLFAAGWAIASKYFIATGRKHLFNPAAFAVALTALVLNQPATWWVGGTLWLLPFVLIGGVLIVRKIQRFDLVIPFGIAALIATALTSPLSSLATTVLHSSFFFLAFVMLTEPATTPPTRWLRVIYGVLVGILFAPNIHFGSVYLTPELALLIGNLFAYAVSVKRRVLLTFVERRTLGDGIYEFIFTPDQPLNFRAGQYLEWTLGHAKADSRGNRRYFTIASAPEEKKLRLGVKFYEPSSTYKKALLQLVPGDTLSAAQLAGDFTLPRDKKRKVAFIAGGIGVTPFRSMVAHLLATKDRRSAVLLYSNKKASEVAYTDTFERARTELGMKTIYAVTNEQVAGEFAFNGPITPELIKREVPDYRDRTFYLSGPHGMVEAFQATLKDMGLSSAHIKVDFFPGFA